MIFGQTFDPADVGIIGLLVLLEGAMSVDNALVLGLLAGRVAPDRAGKALRYGLAAAFVFRAVMVALAGFLIRWPSLKMLGTAYLAYLAIRRFFFSKRLPLATAGRTVMPFWRGVVAIELTDLAFAVDNVLAAVALVGSPPRGWPADQLHPKLWVILTGGMLGVVLSRFAAASCLKLLRRFVRLEASAYLIVLLIAGKLGLEWAGLNFQDARRTPFWAFWIILVAVAGAGFVRGPVGRRADGK